MEWSHDRRVSKNKSFPSSIFSGNIGFSGGMGGSDKAHSPPGKTCIASSAVVVIAGFGGCPGLVDCAVPSLLELAANNKIAATVNSGQKSRFGHRITLLVGVSIGIRHSRRPQVLARRNDGPQARIHLWTGVGWSAWVRL